MVMVGVVVDLHCLVVKLLPVSTSIRLMGKDLEGLSGVVLQFKAALSDDKDESRRCASLAFPREPPHLLPYISEGTMVPFVVIMVRRGMHCYHTTLLMTPP